MPSTNESYRLPFAFRAMRADAGAAPQWTRLPSHSGRVRRALWIGERAGALGLALAALARSAYAQWRQHRRTRAMEVVLRSLDDHTLRDIGFDRSEIGGVAREVAADNGDSVTRVRAMLMQQRVPM